MEMSARAPGAVVIGLDSITGLQTARILAARGVVVTGVARDRRHPACRTRACARIAFADTRTDGCVEALEAMASSFDVAPVLFPCTDLSVLLLSRHRQSLSLFYRMVVPPPGVLELLLDKARFHTHAVEAGLPVCDGRIVRSRGEAEEAAAALHYPCVIKPAVKTAEWQANTSAKVFRVDTPEALLRTWQRCGAWVDRLLVQEWVEGDDRAHVTCNAYFDRGSRPVLTFVSRKLRQWPREGGVGCFSEECDNEEVRAATVDVFAGVGHHGLAYLEMMVNHRTGRHVIIEPNVGRPTGRSAAADAAGVPLVYSLYCDALGLPLPAPDPNGIRGARWVYLRQDCQAAVSHWREGSLTLLEWVQSLRGCRGDAVFRWNDPAPFLADLMRGMSKAVSTEAGGEPAPAPPSSATSLQAPATDEDVADFDVHGLAAVRLVGAGPAEIAMVQRQLGPLRGVLQRAPDITITFVDALPIPDLRYVEYGRTGFSEDGFYILQSGKRPARVRVAIDDQRRHVEYTCERGLRSVPLLLAFVNLVVTGAGCVALHASAFIHQGTGVLVTGWAKGGKTEALLAFNAHGAEYVGDEWILLRRDGHAMYGIPEHIRLQDWHLQQLPDVRRQVSWRKAALFRMVRALDGLRARPVLRRLLPAELLADALPALKRQLNVQVSPRKVFGAAPHGFTGRPDVVFFMSSHADPRTTVTEMPVAEVVGRMAASIAFEQAPLTATYLAYRFAFPDRRSAWLESAPAMQTALLAEALDGLRAYDVRHAYPCDLGALFEAMAPFCGKDGPEPVGQDVPGNTREVAGVHAG